MNAFLPPSSNIHVNHNHNYQITMRDQILKLQQKKFSLICTAKAIKLKGGQGNAYGWEKQMNSGNMAFLNSNNADERLGSCPPPIEDN